MSDFKQGQEVEGSNDTTFVRSSMGLGKFVAFYEGKYICNHGGALLRWKYIRAIKEPERIDYTFETFPRGVVYARIAGHHALKEQLVLSIRGSAIRIDATFLTYGLLAEKYELSRDNCKTWQAASQEVK